MNGKGGDTGDQDGDDELDDPNGDEAFGIERNVLPSWSSVG